MPINPEINRIIALISSIPFAIAIIILLIIILLIGSLLPHEIAQAFVYGSLWFYFLQFVLFVSILSCCIKSYPNSKSKISFILIHSALLIILSGGFISAVLSDNAYIELSEGEVTNQAIRDNKSVMMFPFKIKLDNFNVERYEEEVSHYILLLDRNFNEITVEKLDKNSIINFPEVKSPLIIHRIVSDFSIDSNGQVVNKSKQWNNPAIEIKIGKHKRWLFAKYMRHSFIRLGNYFIVYKFGSSGGDIKSFKSNVTVSDNKNNSISKVIEVNKPLRIQGYVLYQFSYDNNRPDWTAFQIKKDPGVPVVFTGYIMLIIGIIYHLIILSRFKEENSNV